MLKLKPNCAVCTAIKENKKLMNRIYNTSWFVKHSQDSLLKVANDCKGQFSYPSLKNHVKRHQFLNAADYTEKMAKLTAKKAEEQLMVRQLDSTHIWDSVMSRGDELLQAGKLDIKTADLLKAAKDKSDFQFKKSDQQLQVLETIAHFASGENTNNERIYDRRQNADRTPETVDSWQDQSSAFYQSVTGDTPAPGPGPLPVRDDATEE